MALTDDDKSEFKKLFSEAMSGYESAKEEAAAKNQKEQEKEADNAPPAKLTFAERLLGIKAEG